MTYVISLTYGGVRLRWYTKRAASLHVLHWDTVVVYCSHGIGVTIGFSERNDNHTVLPLAYTTATDDDDAVSTLPWVEKTIIITEGTVRLPEWNLRYIP